MEITADSVSLSAVEIVDSTFRSSLGAVRVHASESLNIANVTIQGAVVHPV